MLLKINYQMKLVSLLLEKLIFGFYLFYFLLLRFNLKSSSLKSYIYSYFSIISLLPVLILIF